MNNPTANKTKVLYIVINAGFSDEIMLIAREAGAKGATIMTARGEGPMQKSIMGITVDSEKEILMMLIDDETADKIMLAVKEKAGRFSAAHGICFTMPVEKTTIINNFPPKE